MCQLFVAQSKCYSDKAVQDIIVVNIPNIDSDTLGTIKPISEEPLQ